MEALLSMEESSRRNVVGQCVQKHRNAQKLTQQDLAGRCAVVGFEVGRETISQIERGSRGVSDLELILLSKALRVGITELIPPKLPKWKKDLRSSAANDSKDN